MSMLVMLASLALAYWHLYPSVLTNLDDSINLNEQLLRLGRTVLAIYRTSDSTT